MKCQKCGTENIQDAKYCHSCGEALHETSSLTTEMTTVVEAFPQDRDGRFILGKRFKILKKLGKGGMGEVLLAEDVKLKRKVAIKSVLKKENISDTNSKIRFLREAQTASQLEHPNICTIYEIYEEEDKDYIVMQYIDGVTLDQIIAAKKLGIEKLLDIAIQVCSGMIEAHANEIIHRDIKPSNIIVDKKGVVKILDFGLAKFHRDATIQSSNQLETNLTEKGFVLGTVAYISPEQAQGKIVDKRTDIFSFGSMLFEMIEGTNPFKVDEQIETLYNVLRKEPVFTRNIPENLQAIVRKTLAKNRDDRYSNFSELKQDLENFKSYYGQLKEEAREQLLNEENNQGKTEIIQTHENDLRISDIQKSSDKENLADMVYRMKKFNASTERVEATLPAQPKFFKPIYYKIIPVIIIALLAGVYFMFIKKSNPVSNDNQPIHKENKFYLYLTPFEDNTGEKSLKGENSLPQMIDYLLMETLNQFPEFETIDKETAASLSGEKEDAKIIDYLKKNLKFDIKYQLTGKISKNRDFYSIDTDLKRIGEDSDESSSHQTINGQSKDSFLERQIEELNKRIYKKLFPNASGDIEVKSVSDIFGSDWQKFSTIYSGIKYIQKADFARAESYFKKVLDVLIVKYWVAELSIQMGKNDVAKKLIAEVIANKDKLTNVECFRAQALDAKLKFNIKEQLANLERLKDELPFSKEALFNLGEAYYYNYDPQKAMVYYEQILKLDKKYSAAINHLGYCYSYTGNPNNAINLLEEFRSLDTSSNSFDSLGDGYFTAGALDNAEAMKRQALLPDENNTVLKWPYQTLADIYILRAQFKNADEVLKKYQTEEPGANSDAYVYRKLAYIAYLEKQYSSALEKINASLKKMDSDDINDNSSEAHWLKGLILLSMNQLPQGKTELLWLQKFKDKYQLSKDNFEPTLKYFLHLEALIAEKENQSSKTRQNFQTLFQLKDKLSYWTYYNYQFFHTQYADYLNRSNAANEALTEIENCLKFNDGFEPYIPALWTKAEILEKLNRNSEAKTIYSKIEKLIGPSNESNVYRNLLKTKLR